jgi:hypothetical protein
LQKSSERSIKAQLLRSEAEKVLLDTQAPRPGPVPSVAPEKLPKYTPMPKNLPKVNRENLRTKKQCEVFLKKYEDACVSNPMTEHGSHRWPLWLRLVVEDADKEDLDVLRKLDGTQDWRTAKESFTGRFASKASVYDACRELAACQQRTTESAQAFSERFNRLAEECQLGESDGPSWKTHLLFTYLFQTKLRPRTAKAMMTSNPGKYTSVKTDFDGMQELAKEAESHINDVGLMREQLQQGIFRLEGLGNAAVRSKDRGKVRDRRDRRPSDAYGQAAATKPHPQPIPARTATTTPRDQGNRARDRTAGGHEHGACDRCGRNHRGLCKATFAKSGFKIPGTPPGASGPAKVYAGCSLCKSQDHLSRACPRRQGPSVRAIGHQPPEEEPEELERPHEEDYGCGLCGMDHEAADCPDNPANAWMESDQE